MKIICCEHTILIRLFPGRVFLRRLLNRADHNKACLNKLDEHYYLGWLANVTETGESL